MSEFREETVAGVSTLVVPASRRDFLKQAATTAAVATILVGSGEAFAETPPLVKTGVDDLPEGSLLDEGGMMHRPPDVKTVAAWRRELQSPTLEASRKAHLHLLVGEYDLIIREMPEDALKHFDIARKITPVNSPLHGWAWSNHAYALWMNAQYADAAESFNNLLHKTNPTPVGFDRQVAAYRLRHAGACAASHNRLSDLGIPRPQKIDTLCVVAGFAICMKALKLPYEKRLMKSVVRFTGRGSNERDVIAACDKMRAMGKADVKAHILVADEQGLKALPKPVIAHVEHDHFVTVIEANEKGVAYVCVDCGEWPGGRVDLTWEQWRALEADAYICVVKTNSEPDKVLSKVLNPNAAKDEVASGVRFPGIRVAMNPFRPGQSLGNVTELSAMYRGLLGHVTAIAVNGPSPVTICGQQRAYPACPPSMPCAWAGGAGRQGGPIGCGTGATSFGASAGDPVNLATLEEEYMPPPDLVVYNPTGPDVSWQRSYRTSRGTDAAYSYQDFNLGWTHSYNYVMYDPLPAPVTPPDTTTALRGKGSNVAVTGNTAPSGSNYWEIWRNGQLISYSIYYGVVGPGGWTVTAVSSSGTPPTSITVAPPFNAEQGTGYEVRTKCYPNGTPIVSATFAVGVPGYKAQTAGTKYMVFPNGARFEVTCTTLPTATNPVVSCAVPTGQPYLVQMIWNSTLEQGDYLVTMSDQTQFLFRLMQFKSMDMVYALVQISDRVGNALSLTYTNIFYDGRPSAVPTTSSPILRWIDRIVGNTTVRLLTINRDLTPPTSNGNPFAHVSYINSVSDAYGRSVYYKREYMYPQYPSNNLIEVSQIVATGTSNPPMRYQYGYDMVAAVDVPTPNIPVLKTITVPSPTGTGTVMATVTTNPNTGQVTGLIDANGNTTDFVSVDAFGNPATLGSTDQTTVTVKDTLGNVVYEYTAIFGSNMSNKGSKSPPAPGPLSNNTPLFNSGDAHMQGGGTSGNGYVTLVYGSAVNPFRPTQVIDGMNRTWTYVWDRYCNLLSETTPRGVVTTYTYDYTAFPLGRLVSVQEGSKPAATAEYFEPTGLLKKVVAPAPAGSGYGNGRGVGDLLRSWQLADGNQSRQQCGHDAHIIAQLHHGWYVHASGGTR